MTTAAALTTTAAVTEYFLLFQKELEVGTLDKGTMESGKRAWVAHLEDFDRNPSPWCLLVRAGETSAPNKAVVYDVQRCSAIAM